MGVIELAILVGAVVFGTVIVTIAVMKARVNISRLTAMADQVTATQSELSGRLSQMAEAGAAAQTQIAERLQAQERALTKTVEDRLADVSRRVGESLQKSTERTAESMTNLKERLAVIDAAQKNITELSAQVITLQDILTNRQSRGAFGEIQLQDLVQNALPPSAYAFQATLSNGRRADCVLNLPNPPGMIAIDAKFPLESYFALRDAGDDVAKAQAGRAFSAAVLSHVRDIADRYILPGETAESALMFLPSEAVYAELHAGFPEVIEKSYRARVWIVSPTTLMATLNTVRAVLKDAHMREQAGVIQQEVHKMAEDVTRLDKRVGNLQRHFDQAGEDLRGIRTSADKITRRAERIDEIQLGEETEPAPEELEDPSLKVHRLKPAGR